MSSATATPRGLALQRTTTTDSMTSSSTTPASGSPMDSPRQSASSTSLSSMGSTDVLDAYTSKGKMIDGYGNEFKIPDYTIKQIRDAIPAHCLERSGARGLAYVARDIISLGTTFFLFNRFVTPEVIPSTPVRAVLWALYTFIQGLFGTGLWVLAHECGHQSFSPSKKLNDTVGWICHSALLVPYFSWKISHGKHHKATGNVARDMVHTPKTREVYASRVGRFAHELHELTEETPIATFLHLIVQQIGGWVVYLFTNVTGHDNHERQPEGRGVGKSNGWFGGVNHFNPSSPLYEAKDVKLILLSDLGLAITLSVLTLLGRTYGMANLTVWYIFPYLWVNHWLVAITFLQHTDPSLPHYEPESWNFARGAAATIDREFGFIGRHLLHGIVETHVLHHYVSTIPFYHADEATEAIKPVMGEHYRSDTTNGSLGFIASMYKCARWCNWVEPSEGTVGEEKGVLFYRNRNGLGAKPAALEVSREKKMQSMQNDRAAFTTGTDSE
ncbi:Oleate hydroxylase fah12 [Agyrium rufum]|nr:Oleate hydroxylase fah12 [Agyrium rufum]